jgi:hypothetical protein
VLKSQEKKRHESYAKPEPHYPLDPRGWLLMSFRIERAFVHEETDLWTFYIKGAGGEGRYAHLRSMSGGRGLFLVSDRTPAVEDELLVSPYIQLFPYRCSAEAAVQRLATVLLLCGWGPEVDDRDGLSIRISRDRDSI